MESLPQGPPWHSTEIRLKGYDSIQPIHLFWRDGLEVIKRTFSNPIFSKDMIYDPYAVMSEEGREFGDFFSSKYAWVLQVKIHFIWASLN